MDDITDDQPIDLQGVEMIDSPELGYDLSSERTSPEPRLCNPLSGNTERYISDSTGKPCKFLCSHSIND